MNTLALYLALFMLGVGIALALVFLGILAWLLVAFVRGAFMPAEKGSGVR